MSWTKENICIRHVVKCSLSIYIYGGVSLAPVIKTTGNPNSHVRFQGAGSPSKWPQGRGRWRYYMHVWSVFAPRAWPLLYKSGLKHIPVNMYKQAREQQLNWNLNSPKLPKPHPNLNKNTQTIHWNPHVNYPIFDFPGSGLGGSDGAFPAFITKIVGGATGRAAHLQPYMRVPTISIPGSCATSRVLLDSNR